MPATALKLSVRIDPDLKAELDRFVSETGKSQQYIVQAALAEWLDDAEDLLEVERARGEEFEDWETVKRSLEL